MAPPDRKWFPDGFHGLVSEWFIGRYGKPTEVQAGTWPHIVAGRHVLAAAPTGSGKTLTAFLFALDRLLRGEWPAGQTSVVYVSPLKALNNDISRNILEPLRELTSLFRDQGMTVPDIRVGVRSGDTPESERRKMVRHPPDILITTPESLNLLITSMSGRSILSTARYLILDEIHAMAGNKRGVFLMSAVERLAVLAGEFQRVAMTATARPLSQVAKLVGGFTRTGPAVAPVLEPRKVMIVESGDGKCLELVLRSPRSDGWDVPDGEPEKDRTWKALARECRSILGVEEGEDGVLPGKTGLVFVNSRRLCEKMVMLINQGERITYAHHGSLSREIRQEVEAMLKDGRLTAVVSTNSLELGIDVGDLDRVVLVQTPPSVSSTMQRMGRAGHGVGQTSRAVLLTTHAGDILNGVVMMGAVRDRDLEPLASIRSPLDVLAQVLVSMAMAEGGTSGLDVDEAYAMIRMCAPYRHLDRESFESVLHMLAGRYAETRIRELRQRLRWDRVENRLHAAKGAAMALYGSGGVIPDRGLYALRSARDGQRIGELDEEFVWEARVGQVFTLGAQNWRISRITANDVLVVPADPSSWAAPFWRADERGRDVHFSSRMARFLEQANARAASGDLQSWLEGEQGLDERSAEMLARHIDTQRQVTKRDLPHSHHLLVEHCATGPGGSSGHQIILHVPFGLPVTGPWGLALCTALEKGGDEGVMHFSSNDHIALVLPREVSGEELLSLVTSQSVEELLVSSLEQSGLFGAMFREACGRALLIERRRIGERYPLWLSRLKAAKLMQTVSAYGDFPMLVEAWRSCMKDVFAMDRLREVLDGLAQGAVSWSETRTHVTSPMARDISWQQINTYMYRTDEMPGRKGSGLSQDVLKRAVFDQEIRPRIDPSLVAEFEAKQHRTAEGYAPSDGLDLLDHVKDRLFLCAQEWEILLEAMERDHGEEVRQWVEDVGDRLVRIQGLRGGDVMVAREMEERVRTLFLYGEESEGMDGGDPGGEILEATALEVLQQWLGFHGPMEMDSLGRKLDMDATRLAPLVERLETSRLVVQGTLLQDSEAFQVCDAANLEILLRMSRARARPAMEPMDVERLPLVVARNHGLLDPASSMEELSGVLERLLFLPLNAELWEEEVLPARCGRYDPAWMDALQGAMGLAVVGAPGRTLCLCPVEERDLLDKPGEGGDVAGLFADPAARYDLSALAARSGQEHGQIAERLWEGFFNGRVSNDSFSAIRHGVETSFAIPEHPAAGSGLAGGRSRRPVRSMSRHRSRSSARSSAQARMGSLPWSGGWHLLPYDGAEDATLLDGEEQRRERARILLDRHGILFREMLSRESGVFGWREIFPALRLMELSGEVLCGRFFHGASGPQFMSHQTMRSLAETGERSDIFWMSAMDPASLCGLGIEGLKDLLPARRAGTHLSFRGIELAMVSTGYGRQLDIRMGPDDADLPLIMSPLTHLLTRRFRPRTRLVVESVNHVPAQASPYLDVLRTCFEVLADHRKVTLYPLRRV